jgi:S-formylglutathione hydrolase FrmB
MFSMKKLFCSFVLLFCCIVVFAAKVETVSTYSKVMNKEIKATVVTPDNYSADKRLPVIYLLHGYGGNYSSWATQGKSFIPLVDTYNVIVVCPDGAIGSWYFDSPMDKDFQYETYVTKELIPFVDSHYATIADRSGRGITGLSMGGHGALYLSFRHLDLFGVAGSMSGGVDFRPFPNNWDIAKRLGSYAENPENWEKNTVVNLVHLLTPKSLALIIDCGSEDFFYKVNCQLHEKLLDRNIPHDFISRPGVHNWDFWNNSIQYQMLFMSKFFTKTAPVK